MRDLNLTVYEPGDTLATISANGRITIYAVTSAGELAPGDQSVIREAGIEAPIEALDLSIRAYNVLKREGIHTISQLLAEYDARGEGGFATMRNIGDRALDEVLAAIQQLRGTTDPIIPTPTDETAGEN